MIEHILSLQSIAQIGLAYSKDPFDLQRFEAVRLIAAKLLAGLTELPEKRAQEFIFDEQGYRTPKVDVRGALFHNDRILLVQEKSDGRWCLPGGWADIHETPAQAVEREVFEECGLVTKAIKLAAIHDTNCRGPKQFYQSYKLLFICELIRGEPQVSDETIASAYFPRYALPELSQRRTTEDQIHLLFEHWHTRDRPTEFD